MAGGDPIVLGSSALEAGGDPIPVERRLPVQRWGRPSDAGLGFYARRALAWVRSAMIVTRTVRRLNPDVVHFQAPINRRFDARLVRHIARRRAVVWTAHDVLPFERTDADRGWFAAIYRSVDQVVVHTRPAAEQLLAIAGVQPVVIELPVPEGIERVPAPQARARLGLSVDGRLLCALGFIRPYKGYGLLADVWELLGSAAPRLLVMGELMAEGQRPVLERLASSARVELRLGYASDDDLGLALSASDALLLPYEEASDSGLVHLARAFGVPVIASDTPQLAASVAASGAGVVLARDVRAWASAVTAPLPPPPPAPPPIAETGAKYLVVYEQALVARRSAHRLRVVFYTDSVELGGAEQVLADVVSELDSEFDVVVMGVSPTVVDWVARGRAGVRTCLVPPVRGKRDLPAVVAHWRALRRLNPDVFHANLRHPWSCQYGLTAAILTPGVKVVAVEHLPTPPTASLQRRLKRLTSAYLDAHVAVGHRSAAELERLIGLRPGAIEVIQNGVLVDGAVVRRDESTERSTIGAIGRLTPQKGFDVLLHALVELPEVAAVIAGEGPERLRLERLRDALGLGDRVRLIGSTEGPAAVLRSIDALVLPSRFEALPLVVLEAMHAGIPVVASDVGSVAEAVIDGVTGVLVPPDDPGALASAIRQALDPEVGRRMGARGRELARTRFTRERMANEYQLVYRKLCA
jgi:glycosyltransferase involved in cell wall biosynthesis